MLVCDLEETVICVGGDGEVIAGKCCYEQQLGRKGLFGFFTVVLVTYVHLKTTQSL